MGNLAVFLLILLLSATGALAAEKNSSGIEPGPSVITPEEAAIVTDPDNGVEHAVILTVETDRDESATQTIEITYHFRAKILSNEARDLADITIPFNVRNGRLSEWWGRTILPDGTVHELAEKDLEEQIIVKGTSGVTDYANLKGALPGVEVGVVIDYGYRFKAGRYWLESPDPVPIQGEHQVRKFHYRWTPYSKGVYRVSHEEELGVVTKSDKKSVTFSAENVPALDREPYGPPFDHLRGFLFLYYNFNEIYEIKEFWDYVGKKVEKSSSDHKKGQKAMQKFLASVPLPENAPLDVKLNALYDWIGKNIENVEFMTAESREELARTATKNKSISVREFLEAKEGKRSQIRHLFMALARLLGADAHMVLVVDRSSTFWDMRILSASQFDDFLIAVKAPGETKKKYVVLDPGSGLPYGEIPWQYTMVQGLLCTGGGADSLLIQPSNAEDNETAYKAVIGFEDDGERMTMSWTMTSRGQFGYSERLNLRGLKPKEREDRLFELCGADGDLEVASATVSDLDSITDDLVISCEAETFTDGIGDEVDSYTVSLEGPWIDSVPFFVKKERNTPMVFKHAWTSKSSVEIKAPEGFIPRGGYNPISTETNLGKYHLFIAPAGDGYHLERRFVMPHTRLDTKHYEDVMKYFEFIKRADETLIEFVRKPAS